MAFRDGPAIAFHGCGDPIFTSTDRRLALLALRPLSARAGRRLSEPVYFRFGSRVPLRAPPANPTPINQKAAAHLDARVMPPRVLPPRPREPQCPELRVPRGYPACDPSVTWLIPR